MLKQKTFLALCLLAFPLASVAQQRSAMGPLESAHVSPRTITVLGQTFSVNSATKFAVNGRQISPALAFDILAENLDTYVEGQDKGGSTIATLVSVSGDKYVSGASPVYVLGTVEEISKAQGLIRLRSLQIDSSTMDPRLLSTLRVGSSIEVSGVQPLSGGKVVAAELLSAHGPKTHTDNPARSSKQAQGEQFQRFQLDSVGGSGAQLQSGGGSGIQKQSVGGSGVQLQSVAGSGALKQSIGGSGVQLQSVGGSGIQKQSVGGSGVQLQSVGGSGALKQSIGGSGAQPQSVGGSGIQKQSVGGSGVQLQSVGGSGALKQSVGGSGAQLQSVGGSGLRKQSVGGSGVQLQSVGGSGF